MGHLRKDFGRNFWVIWPVLDEVGFMCLEEILSGHPFLVGYEIRN